MSEALNQRIADLQAQVDTNVQFTQAVAIHVAALETAISNATDDPAVLAALDNMKAALQQANATLDSVDGVDNPPAAGGDQPSV